MIFKNKDRVIDRMKNVVPLWFSNITEGRWKLIEETEKLFTLWMENRRKRNIKLRLILIHEKANLLFEDLKAKAVKNINEESFSASHGWFTRFKKQANSHHVSFFDEASSADTVAVEKFPNTLKEIFEAGGYNPQQIFNVDETGLFWKKMPEKTLFSQDEKTMPGFEAAKDCAKNFWKSFRVYMSIKHSDAAAWHEVIQKNLADVRKALRTQYSTNAPAALQIGNKKIFEDLVEIFKKLDIDLQEKDF